jgi:hypothetical protein
MITLNLLSISITILILMLPIYIIMKIAEISRKKEPVIMYQVPPYAPPYQAPPTYEHCALTIPKEDLTEKIREEIRRQVELEVHQQLKEIRKHIDKDIEIGIIAYTHKQRARQARAQELKDKPNK